jgi:predicted HTH transcriptional regulator
MISESKIKDLIGQPESESLVFQPYLDTSESLAKIIAALANTKGGYLILGVTQKGTLRGLGKNYNLQEVISKIPEYLTPLPSIDQKLLSIEGKKIYVFVVSIADQDILVKGQRYKKIDKDIIMDTPTTRVNNMLPPFFVQKLEEQITEEYEVILRYRKLRSNENNTKRRQEYQQEISLRRENIEEIQKDFLQDVLNTPANNLTEMEAIRLIEDTTNSIKQEISFLKENITDLLKRFDSNLSQPAIEGVHEAINLLKQEIKSDNKENTEALVELILDESYKRDDVDEEIKELIAKIKSSTSLDAKVKLAPPLLKYLGLNIEIEGKTSLIPLLKKLRKKLTGKEHNSN